MAKNYVTAGSRAGVQVVSQTQVVPVQLVNVYTKPHATYFIAPIPLTAWQAGNAAAHIEPIAATIETLWTDGFISGASYGQDVDQSELLASYIDFTVSFTPGGGIGLPYTTIVRVPLAALSSTTAFTTSSTGTPYGEQIAQAYNQLAATSQL